MDMDEMKFSELKKKLDFLKSAEMRLEVESQAIDAEIAELEKELKEKYGILPDELKIYREKGKEQLKKMESEIDQIYEKIKQA